MDRLISAFIKLEVAKADLKKKWHEQAVLSFFIFLPEPLWQWVNGSYYQFALATQI